MVTEEKTYNGWTNYETWAVNLWIDNDQGSQEYWQRAARQAWRSAVARESLTRKEVAAASLADQIKDEITEAAPDLGASLFSDLLSAAFSEVNWDEIASHMVEDLEDDTDEDEDEDEDA